jgi:hypothetical protein
MRVKSIYSAGGVMRKFCYMRLSTQYRARHDWIFAGNTTSLRLIALVLVLVLSQGCAVGSLIGGPSLDNLQPGTLLFSDDFSSPPSGWGTWSRDGAVVEYHNGGLRIHVKEAQYDFWSVAGKNFADVQVEVDAVKIGGPDDNDYGIICRYVNKDNFYMLVISSDGYYGIAKMKNGQHSMIGTEQLQYNRAAINGQGNNNLRADCVGQTLSIYANGHKLMETQDTDFASGDVGVLVGAYNLPGVDILFDNFVVKMPDSPLAEMPGD